MSSPARTARPPPPVERHPWPSGHDRRPGLTAGVGSQGPSGRTAGPTGRIATQASPPAHCTDSDGCSKNGFDHRPTGGILMDRLRTTVALPWIAAIIGFPIGGYLGH